MADALMHARALLLHDLGSRGLGHARYVDLVEDAVIQRRWWVQSWPEGEAYVAGQMAQDVQDRLLDDEGERWPACPRHAADHELRISPELGAESYWTCGVDDVAIAPLGALPG